MINPRTRQAAGASYFLGAAWLRPIPRQPRPSRLARALRCAPESRAAVGYLVLAAFLCTALMIGGISAWYLLRGRFQHKARFCLKSAVAFVAIVAPLQVLVGDLNALKKQNP